MQRSERMDADPDDRWMYFGSFSKEEIAGATEWLRKHDIVFEVRTEPDQPSYDPKGWSGPNALWIADDDCLRAQAILVPFFSTQQREPRSEETHS